MSAYNTLNPVPSIAPKDLDDNATVFDLLLNQAVATVLDRMGAPRKTWWQIEQDALALVSPNVSALSGLAGAADRLPYFTGSGAMSLTTLTAAARTVLDDTTVAAMLATMGGAPLASPALTGTPTGPTAAPGANTTQLATTAFVEAVRVILAAADALKAPLASPPLTGTPTAPTPAVGTNTTQLATAAMIQAEIANKRAWTNYTPTLTASAGAYTSATATGSYMVAFGMCFVGINISITTKGTGTTPIVTLPFAARAGSSNYVIPGGEALTNGKGALARITAGLSTVVVSGTDASDIAASGSSIYIMGSYPIA